MLTLALHAAGMHDLYWTISWYDAPVHFAGGMGSGAIGLYIWLHSGIKMESGMLMKYVISLLFVLGVAALIGIAWEWHEYLLDVYHDVFIRQENVADTMQDFFMDLTGAALIYVIFGIRAIRKNQQ